MYIFPSFPFFFVPGLYIVADTEGDGLFFLSDLCLILFRFVLFRLVLFRFGSLLVKALTIFLILAAFFFASLLVFSGE